MVDFGLKLISPDEEHYNGFVNMVVLPGEDGDFAAMPEHSPLITYLRPGKIDIFEKDQISASYFVGSGFVKVEKDNCLVMVDFIKNIDQMDKSKIEKELADIIQREEKEENKNIQEKLNERIKILQAQLDFAIK